MPSPLQLTKPDFATKLGLKGTELVKWALLIDKTSGNPAQTVNSATFQTNWGIDSSTLVKALTSLERAKLLKPTYAPFTLTWRSPFPTTGMTAAEVQAQKTAKVIDDWTAYVFYALLLTKGTAATQTVDPVAYAAAPWSIPSVNLIAEVNNLSNKGDTPAFSVVYPTITVTWLETIGNA